MYSLFRKPPARFTGRLTFPPIDYLRRSYAKQLEDVKRFYALNPKRVDADNVIGNILIHIPRRDDLDDRQYLRFVEDAASGVSRAFGLTSSIYRGRVHESGLTLGPKTNEVMMAVSTSFNPLNFDKEWYRTSPLTYLYHTRTDLGLPILNNTTPGKGSGVSVLDIPMLALQYRYWLKYQSERYEQKESVYRFIGGFVLPNALDSYLDIAFFNWLSRYSNGVGIPRLPVPHPFYLTDHSRRVSALCEWIIQTNERRSGDLEQAVYMTPMLVKDNLGEVMRLPQEPTTRMNEWALQLARLPYIRYLVETFVLEGRGDRRYINDIYTSLIDASYDNIFSGVGSPDIVKQYRSQIRTLIDQLEDKKQGWV